MTQHYSLAYTSQVVFGKNTAYIIMCWYIKKQLYSMMNKISLVLHDSEEKPRKSVNNKGITQGLISRYHCCG